MAVPTYDNSAVYGFNSDTNTTAFTTAGSNRLLLLQTNARDVGGGNVTGVTYGGAALTQIGTTVSLVAGATEVKRWRLTAPASGANNIVVTLSGAREVQVCVLSYADADQTTPHGTVVEDTDLSVASSLTADQNLASFAAVQDNEAPGSPQFTSTGTAQTERQDAEQGRQYSSCATQTGTGTVTASYTYASTAEGECISVIPVNGITTSGPTIDTQPTAGTVVLNNDTRTSKTFTVAATTSGGALSYQWQDEDSVGAGTYTNISNGGIHAGATTASLVVTPTTKTGLTGIRYRCNVTDDNGTTTTNAVALTVYNGVILSAASATTNGSGVATITYTTDLPVTTNGAFNKFSATLNGATSLTSGRPT